MLWLVMEEVYPHLRIIIRCVVQRQLYHCWMGQTPCGEGFVGSNAISASISVMSKEILGITIDAFENF